MKFETHLHYNNPPLHCCCSFTHMKSLHIIIWNRKIAYLSKATLKKVITMPSDAVWLSRDLLCKLLVSSYKEVLPSPGQKAVVQLPPKPYLYLEFKMHNNKVTIKLKLVMKTKEEKHVLKSNATAHSQYLLCLHFLMLPIIQCNLWWR